MPPPALTQQLPERSRRLRAGGSERAIDDEERHGADPERRPDPLVLADLLRVTIGGQHGACLLRVQAGLGGQPRENLVAADQLTLGQVRAHQPLLERILKTACRGEVEQAVRVECVAPAKEVEAEVEAVAGCGLGHRALHLQRLLAAGAVLLGEMGRGVLWALARRARIELEAAPGDLHVIAVLEALQRGLEAALADVAPGTGDIGPDLDVQVELPRVFLLGQPLPRLATHEYPSLMCRNIRELHNYAPPATDEEIRAAALQYVRKVGGSSKPSRANADAFERAVDQVTVATATLLEQLVSAAPPKDREAEAAKRRERSQRRFAA